MEFAVEALRRAILPRLAELDRRGTGALRDDPRQQRLRHELFGAVKTLGIAQRDCSFLSLDGIDLTGICFNKSLDGLINGSVFKANRAAFVHIISGIEFEGLR